MKLLVLLFILKLHVGINIFKFKDIIPYFYCPIKSAPLPKYILMFFSSSIDSDKGWLYSITF